MSCNCGLNEIFTDRVSAHDARKYRRRGLDIRARRMLRAIESRIGLKDRTTLEVGIGTGGFTIEMLRRGTTRSYGVDALPNQLAQAKQLANEAGVADRLILSQGDFTEMADSVASADVVVLDRVVCCYPNWKSLLAAASNHAGAAIVMSYPREAWYTKLWVAGANLGMRLLRRAFRLYLHSPGAMHEMLRNNGFKTEVIGHRVAWELLVATRR